MARYAATHLGTSEVPIGSLGMPNLLHNVPSGYLPIGLHSSVMATYPPEILRSYLGHESNPQNLDTALLQHKLQMEEVDIFSKLSFAKITLSLF